jgi:hypothetical protein
MSGRLALALLLMGGCIEAQQYKGPEPPKSDVLYLVRADNLDSTEVVEAKEEQKKDLSIYTIPGASSPAKTPLTGPILLLKSDKLSPEKLALYQFSVKDDHREITFNRKKPKDTQPIRFSVQRLAEGLYRLEVDASLENGEYGFSPEASNQVFCFQVY